MRRPACPAPVQRKSWSYSWSFGDGTTGTGKIVTHTFSDAGVSYNVTLTVTNDLGLVRVDARR